MIHIKRSTIVTPKQLKGTSSPAAKERKKVIDYYKKPANTDKTFPFKVYKNEAVKQALNTLFHYKCAYCESNYGATQPVDIEHYRPKGAVLVNGRLKKPGYYWLAADWNNLLPSCIDCNRARKQTIQGASLSLSGKANQFPLENEAKRAKKPGEEKKERPLLLDPCCDKPEEHLEFIDEGVVRATLNARNKPSNKGVESIKVYGLQRRGLVQARRDRLIFLQGQTRRVADLIEDLDQISDQNPLKSNLEERLTFEMAELHRLQEEDQPYAGMARQFVKRFLESIG